MEFTGRLFSGKGKKMYVRVWDRVDIHYLLKERMNKYIYNIN